MLSAYDHRFPFWGIAVALNIGDSYPQQEVGNDGTFFECRPRWPMVKQVTRLRSEKF